MRILVTGSTGQLGFEVLRMLARTEHEIIAPARRELDFLKPGQVAEVALDLYPGQIFPGTVEAIWQGSGAGQMLPSGVLPDFQYVPTEVPQGQFAVAIRMGGESMHYPIGTQGRAAIYTNPDSPFVWLRRIGIRTYSWLNWIYPFSG